MQQEQKTSQQPDIDQLISQANSQVYVFEHSKEKKGLKDRLRELSRTKKIVFGIAAGFLVIAIIAISLSTNDHSPKNTPLASQTSNSGTSGNGTPQDTNGDGAIDENDTASTDTSTDASETSWWQKILNIGDGQSSSTTNNTNSSSTGNTAAIVDEADDNTANDGQSNDGVPELENEDVIVSNSPAATNTGTSSVTLTIASWNVYKFNKSDVVGNIKKVLSSADILGLQEAGLLDDKIMSKVACSSCAYDMYPTSKGSPKKIAVLWNKNKFDVLEKGYNHLSTQDGVKKYVVWLKFKDKVSKKVFYVLNTHVPFGAGEGPGFTTSNEAWRKRAIAAYKDHITAAATRVKKMQQSNLPIFFIGDFAANYRKDNCSNSYFPCNLFAKQLSLKSGWEYTKLSGISKSTGTISDSTRIPDYVFSWQKNYISYQSMKILYGGSGAGWGGSDHKPVGLRLVIGSQN